MLKIRRGCFETNSSSTHAICIPAVGSLGSGYTKRFRVGRYGWENGDADADDYLYTAICERYENDEEARQAALDKIRAVCAKHNIECDFIEPKWWKWSKDESRYPAVFSPPHSSGRQTKPKRQGLPKLKTNRKYAGNG